MIYCLYILGITAAYAALDSGVDGQVVGLLAVWVVLVPFHCHSAANMSLPARPYLAYSPA